MFGGKCVINTTFGVLKDLISFSLVLLFYWYSKIFFVCLFYGNLGDCKFLNEGFFFLIFVIRFYSKIVFNFELFFLEVEYFYFRIKRIKVMIFIVINYCLLEELFLFSNVLISS